MTVQSTGKCRIDGVSVGEVQIDAFASPGPVLSARYAYVSSSTGARMGSSHRNTGWSEATLKRLTDLVASMEQDICGDVFEEGTTSGGVLADVDSTTDGIPSL